ncbi:M56 family metallopeptidase [Micromonospora aurantiaca (nom. illeg.)]|uniref:M56 family metallopeptidase n=1 Tax=Micromonospora aurantiaca (nom. illeg.) TaxID=47850 RepID=UPI0001BF3E36|nr:M56 family metallopeptidase [Micromonospora aurantiaca]ADL47495.1 peptidase M48, Ste24p [Micromonospora aurantiaca ATCC 27029]
MSLALALVTGAAAVAWWGPAALRWCFRHVADPVAMLLGWLGLLVAMIATFLLATVMLLAPGSTRQWALHDLARVCWHWAQPSRPAAVDEVVGAVGALLLLTVLARFTMTCTQRAYRAHRARRAHADLLTLVGGPPASGEAVLWIPHPTPMAYSIGGSRGLTVLASAAGDLPAEQLAAVLSHERAHLRERHHLLVGAVEGLAAAVPWLPLTRQAPSAVRLLVELRADAAAVRECGPRAVRDALLTFAGAPHPPSALSMAGAEVAIRLQRLQGYRPDRRNGLARAALASATLAAPLVVGVAAGILFCL